MLSNDPNTPCYCQQSLLEELGTDCIFTKQRHRLERCGENKKMKIFIEHQYWQRQPGMNFCRATACQILKDHPYYFLIELLTTVSDRVH